MVLPTIINHINYLETKKALEAGPKERARFDCLYIMVKAYRHELPKELLEMADHINKTDDPLKLWDDIVKEFKGE